MRGGIGLGCARKRTRQEREGQSHARKRHQLCNDVKNKKTEKEEKGEKGESDKGTNVITIVKEGSLW